MFSGGQVGCSKSRKIKIGREATAPLKGRAFKIEISKVSGSTLVAEICTDPHNRLLRRQHCSSLCSQSEGHEHVANMTNALGHDFVGFSVLVRHNIRPPHFASKVSYSASPQASAKCSRDAPCSDAALACYLLKNEPKFSWILNTLPRTLPCSGLVGLSARAGPQTRLFPHKLHQLNISILNTLRGAGRRISLFLFEAACGGKNQRF